MRRSAAWTKMDNEHLPPESEELRVVLLGKTGVGKSASGNIILGSDEFKIASPFSSGTAKCEKKTGQVDGKPLAIVDTPGLFYVGKSPQEVIKEIQKVIKLIEPGAHVFLLVLRLDRFDREDKKTLEAFKKLLQDAKQHTVVLFTHGNTIEKGSDVRLHQDVKDFIDESCEAHYVFNINVKDESQVSTLLETFHKIKSDYPEGYNNEELKKQMKDLKKDMRASEGNSDSWVEAALTDPVNFIIGKFEDWAIKFS